LKSGEVRARTRDNPFYSVRKICIISPDNYARAREGEWFCDYHRTWNDIQKKAVIHCRYCCFTGSSNRHSD